jgi:excisionase family DNA binding protein
MHPHEHAAERQVEPLYVSIPNTARLTGLSTATIYRLIANGELVCVKAGAKSLVEVASVKSYLASLPRFVGRTGQAARAKGEGGAAPDGLKAGVPAAEADAPRNLRAAAARGHRRP